MRKRCSSHIVILLYVSHHLFSKCCITVMAVRVKVELVEAPLNEKDRNEVEDVLQQLLANSEKNVQEEVQCVLQDQQSDLVQEKISNENDHNERMSPVVNGGSNEETTMIIGELQQDQQSEMPEEQRAKAPVNDKDDMHVTEVESVPIQNKPEAESSSEEALEKESNLEHPSEWPGWVSKKMIDFYNTQRQSLANEEECKAIISRLGQGTTEPLSSYRPQSLRAKNDTHYYATFGGVIAGSIDEKNAIQLFTKAPCFCYDDSGGDDEDMGMTVGKIEFKDRFNLTSEYGEQLYLVFIGKPIIELQCCITM